MAFGNNNKTYNNNENKPTTTTYTPISFANSESKIAKTRFSISYFNRMMKISIAKQINEGSADQFAKYDNDNAVTVYVSYTKAKMLHDLMVEMKNNKKINNVCIDLTGGLLKVSNGIEFGSELPCFSITYGDDAQNINEIIYQNKGGYYSAAYNYNEGKFDKKTFDDMEYDTFLMVLEQYYIASSYSIAAFIKEATMYHDNSQYNMLRAIAEKIGAVNGGGKSARNYNSMSFLAGDGNNTAGGSNNSGVMNGASEEYESSTFADIANSMGIND